jgi:16S rRNA (cytidine1402-2'-O)-methyltransferase
MEYGKLYLIPSSLGSNSTEYFWPAGNLLRIRHIHHFIVENVRSARRFLRLAGYDQDFEKVHFFLLNKHTTDIESGEFLNAAKHGYDIGLLSEAGVPCIADPGQTIVKQAHRIGIGVVPLTGASSILLGLMASGFNGQHFVFHGYLPIQKKDRVLKIKEIEKKAFHNDQTQIFMETPFRNNQLLADLLSICSAETMLCIACDLTLPTEYIRTFSIQEWKKKMPDLNKRPGIFLLYHK